MTLQSIIILGAVIAMFGLFGIAVTYANLVAGARAELPE